MRNIRLRQKKYFDVYHQDYEPWLKDIDIFVKCNEPPFNALEVAKMLRINIVEVIDIIGHEYLSKEDFFALMNDGSSDICRLYHREIQCRSPFLYTAADIAYIYNLDFDSVNHAFNELGIAVTTAYNLPDIFLLIPAKALAKP